MTYHYPTSLYNKNCRSELFPLLKPFLKRAPFTDAQRIQQYGISENDVSFVESVEVAKCVILPMSWNYYLKSNRTKEALQFIELVKQYNKYVLVYVSGDFVIPFPNKKHVIILRPSGYLSNSLRNHEGLPVFIADPLMKFYRTQKVFKRMYTKEPVIGFCGLANGSKLNALKNLSKAGLRNTLSFLGVMNKGTEKLIASSYFRASILKSLKASSSLKTNFKLRKKYRAGALSLDDKLKTSLEFYDNIRDSDYTVCVRGAGNFSVRLYETLAMGRIPIFINTDCMLPLHNDIPWRKHMVWVEKHECHMLEDKILAFHEQLNETTMNYLFEANRELWLNKIRLKGFFEALNIRYSKIK